MTSPDGQPATLPGGPAEGGSPVPDGALPLPAAALASAPGAALPLPAAAALRSAPEGDRDAGSTITLYDVARLAGVSTATVSRVLHGQDRVRDTTRARVQQVIEQLGYIPDGAAQSLSRRRKDVIGIICVERLPQAKHNDIESMNLLYYDEIVRGVGAGLRDRSMSLLITYVEVDNEREFPRLMSLLGKVDGLLIGEGIVPSSLLERLAERIPVVVIAGDPAEHTVDVVTADNRSGSAALVSHLIEVHGKRRFFHVGGPPEVADARERRLALDQVLAAHPESRLIGSSNGLFRVQSGEDAGEDLLTRCPELPDAVVCGNDQMAIGVLQAFARAGISVPSDVAVVGFDDIYPGSLYDPALTTVHQPVHLLGERASARLLDRIATPGLPPKVELLPTELVLRASCGCPAGSVTRRPVEPCPPGRATES